jgi:cytochrome c-type biogenesis protein CcmE
MKKSHIIAVVIIAIAIGFIISTAGDASTYVCFREAYAMSAEGDDHKVHVVGRLKKDKSGRIEGLQYNPVLDPNHFEFVLVDNEQKEQKVVYTNPKPQDFEKSEQIVIIGSVKNNLFVADKILMKCPSKYEDKNLQENISDNSLKQ